MKQLLSSVLVAFVLTFFVIPVHAQDQKGVANVTVMICDADGKVVSRCKTDKDGKFDCPVQKAHSDYYLQIDEKDRKSKFAINEQGVKRASYADADSDGDGTLEYYLQVDSKTGYNVKAPRDAASGQASGKRQHGAIRITNDFSSCPISIDEPGVTITGQIYGMAINEKGLPGEKKPKKSTK